MNERIKDFIEGSVGYLSAALVAIVYVAAGLLIPGVNDKPLVDIIREGVVGFAMGVSMNFCLSLQGILKGKRSVKMENTITAHGEAVTAVEPHIHRLDGWCEMQNARALKQERTRILMAAGLRYEDCFDKDGIPREMDFSILPEDMRKMREKAMRKATRLRLTTLSAASLTSEVGRDGDPFYFGESVEKYQARTNLKDALSKLVIAVGFGYFSVDMVLSMDVGALLWRALYVVLLLALGVSKLLRSYLFITDTYRGGIVKRINHLQSFKNWAEQTPEKEEKDGKHDHN
ncbi:MAG: hypothetical protein IJC99_04240 [Clostridia bacterium]|nr:hypothetical protein [Clostridia bacterium]